MKTERPVPLTILCILGFLVCSLGMILVYSPSVQKVGSVYAIYRSFGFTFLVICFAGIWSMRRWAVWAFGGYFLLNQAVCWLLGVWDTGTLGPLVVLALLFSYYRRMR